MRISFILALLMVFNLHAQSFEKIQGQCVKYSNDSTMAIVLKGKKQGLYDLEKNAFAIEMTKDELILFPVDNLILQIDKEGKIQAFRRDDSVLKKSILEDHICDTLDDNRYYFRDYNVPYLRTNKDGDNIGDQQHPSQGSGIFNHQTREWEVPPNYASIYRPSENYLLAQRFDSIWWPEPDYIATVAMHYDVYKDAENGFELIHSNISTLEELPYNELFGIDSICHIRDYVYQSYKDRKRGIVLAYPFEYSTIGNYQGSVQELFEPYFDYIIQEPDKLTFITLEVEAEQKLKKWKTAYTLDNKYVPFVIDSNTQILLFQDPNNSWGSMQSLLQRDSIDLQEMAFKTNEALGLEFINDTLVKYINTNRGYSEAVMSIEYPGEDSVDWEGNLIYERIGLYNWTGIWDLKNNRWEVDSTAYDVYFGDDYTVYHYPEYVQFDYNDNGSMETLGEWVLVTDNMFGPIEREMTFYDFKNDKKYLSYFYPKGTVKSIDDLGNVDKESIQVSTNDESYTFHKIVDYLNMELGYLVRKNNGMVDLVYPGNLSVKPYIIRRDVDFAMAEPRSEWVFSIMDNQMEFSLPDTSFNLNLNDEMIYNEIYHGDIQKHIAQLTLIQNGDSVHVALERESKVNRLLSNPFSVKKIDELYIINSCPTVQWEIWDELYFEFYEVIKQEKERSALWKQTDTGFVRLTPFYAEIIPNDFGYIVRTGEFSGYPEFDYQNWGANYKHAKPSRFLLMNKELKNEQFLDRFDFDFIEDLGFGLSLTTEKGKLFVTYSGEAITLDEWDTFELEDGKLKAMKLNEMVDEYGEPYFFDGEKWTDWDGKEIDPIKEFKYFDLKK